jgi:RNA polymerase sigma-70 factor (ECF subfamily)
MTHDKDQKELFLKEFTAARDDILAYIYSLVPSHAEAEDIFQDVSLLLWQKFDAFETGRNFRAWARKFAWNTVQNWKRTRKEVVWDREIMEALEKAFDAEEQEQGTLAEIKRALERCLNRLPAASRLILQQLYGANMSYEGLGRLLDRSYHGLKVTAHRIRQKLRECVEQVLFAEKAD